MKRTHGWAALCAGALFLVSIEAYSKTHWPKGWPWYKDGVRPVVGVNIGWQPKYYGSDLTSNFHPEYWRDTFRAMKDRGLEVGRIWILESGEGVVSESKRIEVAGVEPRLLNHIRTVADLAEEEGVLIYWTLLNGNTEMGRRFFELQRAISNNENGQQAAFIEKVMMPIVRLIAEHPSTFALDLMNELEGALYHRTVSTPASGRRFIRRMVRAIKRENFKDFKITASAGWHIASATVGFGLYRGLGLDFYDIHTYANSGAVPGCKWLRGSRKPILLGEYGPLNSNGGPDQIAHSFKRGMENAAECGLVGALPWKMQSPPSQTHHSLQDKHGNWMSHALPWLELVQKLRR